MDLQILFALDRRNQNRGYTPAGDLRAIDTVPVMTPKLRPQAIPARSLYRKVLESYRRDEL
jgi:hypothetical protein